MYDYQQLETLYEIVESGSFEKAAQRLRISQSAVSQRIQNLEEVFGKPLCLRTTPVVPTEVAKELLKHFQQVKLLEREVRERVSEDTDDKFITVPIATNMDSLDYWLLEVLIPFLKKKKILLKLYSADETETQQLLREGKVYGCITSNTSPPAVCRRQKLGKILYRFACTKEYKKKYFPDGVCQKSLKTAPGIIFNESEKLLFEYLRKTFGLKNRDIPLNHIPSTAGYVKYITSGLSYGLIPLPELKNSPSVKKLIDLAPIKPAGFTLYWQSWYLESDTLREVREEIVRGAGIFLE